MRKFYISFLALLALLPLGLAYATAPDALGGSAFPLTFISQNPVNLTDSFNEMLQIINAQTTGISTAYSNAIAEPTGGADTSGAVFSTTPQINPLALQTYQDVVVSTSISSVATYTVLASQAGRTIYPGAGMSIMVSGTLGGATGLALECSDGTLFASWAAAALVDQKPVGPFFISSTSPAQGAAITKGCLASKAVLLSNIGGAITTTTHIYVNLPYTVQ